MCSKVPINIQTEHSGRSEKAFSSVSLLKDDFTQKMSLKDVAQKEEYFLC